MKLKKKHIIIITTILIILMGSKLQVTDSTKRTKKTFQSKQEKLDKIYSNKKLGSFVQEGKTYFRLFAPTAEKVSLLTFEQPEQIESKEFEMTKDENGVWDATLDGELYGLFYGYKVCHPGTPCIEDIVCIDPYAKAVTTFNTYYNPRRSIVVKEEDYDWEDDEWLKTDWRDLIIYEMHIRDMTAHPSSGVNERGTYKGLVEKGKTGGIDYIKNLGVNAVELLPSQEFANIEIPFKDSLNGKFNHWNPYERNHWGYMTAAFFSPESYYSENVNKLEWNKWSGKDAQAVTDFKDMVKVFHKEGISVIMDVVYNHISEYEIGNLKEIDKEYYFRLESDGDFIAQSGCGNDFRTEAPMARRMIVESVLYWMKEYHVDGFRFDLGKLIDWETLELVIHEAKKINPYVIFVCEPWGGGYDPAGFSVRGWGSWNDQIRNGIKGENPFDGHGWIFGKWYGNNNLNRLKSYVNGTLVKDKFGLFQKPEHSVNYLESHDGYTLGDFIRLGLADVEKDQVIENVDELIKLTPTQLKLNKLAALFLFTSRGLTMIHSGQEFARTKVVTNAEDVEDTHKGMIDHNSYEKDNETNFINYLHAEINKELLDYYKGLIELRKTYKAFRKAEYDDVTFMYLKNKPFTLQYVVKYDTENFRVICNANPKSSLKINLEDGEWDVLVDEKNAGTSPIKSVSGTIIIPPSAGMILKKK
ncbi:MAG: pullulanase [Ignavibacteriaceae bacterium]|nr:pullulanase [Ignavibacteria bacterium]MBT8390289.1 pullulanase [Ignavibacteria bacterium]NNJ53221.1 pullulanase [Ignavibacteriaceae bacterium]